MREKLLLSIFILCLLIALIVIVGLVYTQLSNPDWTKTRLFIEKWPAVLIGLLANAGMMLSIKSFKK